VPEMSCSKCGTVLAAGAVLYDQSGNAICQRCLMAKDALDSRKDVAKKLRNIAYGGPAAALVSLVFNPFLILTLAAILNGVYVLGSVREPEMAKLLEGSVEKIKVAAIAGIVLGGVSALLHIVLRVRVAAT
jgi:hypothetical protein